MPAPKRTGTGFIGLGQYLGLNRGAAQGMGDALASGVETAGAGVENDSLNALRGFDKQVQAGVQNRPGSAEGLTAAQAAAGAEQGYSGPTSLDFTDFYGRGAEAQNAANALGVNAGRATLLQKQYGPTTWGGSQLDAALAGQGGAGKRLGAAQGAYGKLLSTLQGRDKAAQGMVDTAQKTSQATQDWYAGQVPGLQQQEAQAKQDARTAASTEHFQNNRAQVDANRERKANPHKGGATRYEYP